MSLWTISSSSGFIFYASKTNIIKSILKDICLLLVRTPDVLSWSLLTKSWHSWWGLVLNGHISKLQAKSYTLVWKVKFSCYLYKCSSFTNVQTFTFTNCCLEWIIYKEIPSFYLHQAKSPIFVKLTHFSSSQNSSFNYFILL